MRHYLYALNVTKHPSRHVILLHATCTCSCQVVSVVYHMWILKNSKDLLDNLKSRSFSQVSSIKTFDFSTLYTTLPHDKLKTRLKETIHKAFSHRNYGSKFVVLGYKSTYFSNKIHKGKTCYFRGTSDQYAGVPH